MTSKTPLAKNPLIYLGLVAIITIILIVQVGAFFQLQRLLGAAPAEGHVSANTLINYGNGTSRWHNRTDVPSNWNFYQLTTTIALTETSHGSTISGQHYVTGLDGVRNSDPSYWTLWLFCEKDSAWATSPVGADLVKLKNGDILAWYYQPLQSIDPTTWESPVHGAPTVRTCSA